MVKNTKSFSDTVKGQTGDKVTFSELTDFDWESAYVFVAYKSKEEMEEVIGVKSDEISDFLDYDDSYAIVFVSGDKVVASVSGTPSTLGYDLDLGTVKNYRRIRKDDTGYEFGISNKDGIVTLTILKQETGTVIDGGCEEIVKNE